MFSHPFTAGSLAPSRLDDLKKRYEENPRRFFAPLANEYRKQGDVKLAITLCQEHIAEQPGNMNGHVVYGQALFDADRYPEAASAFTTALSLDPENLIALRHLGDISRLNRDVVAALAWYQRVLDADPRNDEILAFITELKRTQPAPPLRVPDNAEVAEARSVVPPAPAADAPIAEPITGPRPQVFVTETMAELYLQQGFRDEALKVYRQLAELDPNDESLKERIAALRSGGRATMTLETLDDATPDYAPGTESLVQVPETPIAAASLPGHPTQSTGRTARAFFAALSQRRALRSDATLATGTQTMAERAPAVVSTGGDSLDSLFAAVPAAVSAMVPTAEDDAMGLALATAVAPIESAPNDDAQFQSWLAELEAK